MSSQQPFLIIGQGLAGTALAWQFWSRGIPFFIVDADEPNTSSKLAAGLVTPITGLRLTLSWNITGLLPVALEFYHGIETRLGGTFYHQVPSVRLLRSEKEVAFWQKRQQTTEIAPWVDISAPSPLVDPAVFHQEFGGLQQRNSGWLDTASYLKASRAFFDHLGCWQKADLSENDLHPTSEGVAWEDRIYQSAVFCRGWRQQQQSRFFPWLEFGSARGTIMDLEADIPESRIINRGCWMLPRGKGLWRTGSTYDFDLNRPLEESAAELRQKLETLLKVPFHLSNPRSGVRPVLPGRQLALGRHPVHNSIAIFNGLGSKGVLRAPYYSGVLADHLLDGKPLPEAVDVRSNY